MDPKFEPVMSGQPARPRPQVFDGTVTPPLAQNNVLRNTYWLLALSMLPTVGGAYVGSQLNLFALYVAHPIAMPLGMFGAMIGMLFVTTRLRNSAWGVAALLAFTFVAGLTLTPTLTYAAGFRNGGQLVALAGLMTAAIFGTMATVATVSKRDFSGMGKFLMIGTVVVLVAMVANLFLQMPALYVALSAICVVLFSAWLLHDLSRIVRGGETNYVMATMNVYLDLLNIFISLLNLLLAFTGQRD
jgi:FtsH-binding integral membrane protein